MEKLLIKNFAGLKNVAIEIKPITGFIGPQASGKSVIAKLLYFFREIGFRLPTAVIRGADELQYKNQCRERFKRYFPSEDDGFGDFEIVYYSKDEHVRIKTNKTKPNSPDSVRLEWSDIFPRTIKKLASEKPADDENGESDSQALDELRVNLRERYDDEVAEALEKPSVYQQIFIPAGRAFFSQLNETLFTSLDANESIDPFMVAFGLHFGGSKNFLNTQSFFNASRQGSLVFDVTIDFLRSVLKTILRAEVIERKKQYFLRFDDGRQVKLAQASFGQQELFPLLLSLARFVSVGSARGRAIYIEEPEAHLFPVTQKQIVEFIVRVFRKRQTQMCVVLTTHSPYILTSINNLIQAGKLYKDADRKTKQYLERIVPAAQILKSGEVGFYALEDGGAKSIMDPESGLIDAAAIDSVSDEIAMQFDELLEGHEKS